MITISHIFAFCHCFPYSHTILSRLIYPSIFYFSLFISPTSHSCISSLFIYLFRAYYWWWLAGSNWGNICRFQDSSVGCFSTSHCHSRRNIYHWWSVPWTVIYFKIVSIFSHDGSNFCVQHSLSQTIIQNQRLSFFHYQSIYLRFIYTFWFIFSYVYSSSAFRETFERRTFLIFTGQQR